MTIANYTTASDAFDQWKDAILSNEPPVFYPIAESGPLANIEIGPKRITLIGGAPGCGKTALVMQGLWDATEADGGNSEN